jgi:hypothetical protein
MITLPSGQTIEAVPVWKWLAECCFGLFLVSAIVAINATMTDYVKK